MSTSQTAKDISERLRKLLDDKYPSRGRFTALAANSAITASRWKNFYYRKQEASRDMLDFWCATYPMDRSWLMTGNEPPDREGFPFAGVVPEPWEGGSIGDRLNWVIREWASSTGEHLFKYLEQRSCGSIPAAEWSKAVLRLEEPSLAMVQLVCSYRPRFTEWVLLGKATSEPAVDPSNGASVENWKRWHGQTASKGVSDRANAV